MVKMKLRLTQWIYTLRTKPNKKMFYQLRILSTMTVYTTKFNLNFSNDQDSKGSIDVTLFQRIRSISSNFYIRNTGPVIRKFHFVIKFSVNYSFTS